MIRNEVHVGMNRTGIETSPIDKRELIDAAAHAIPSMEGDETAIDGVRAEYLVEDAGIGTLPPPTTVKGAAGMAIDALKGEDLAVFIDKVGERLAFERTGVRLYTALLDKFDASAPLHGGPSREDLEEIQTEELLHFDILRDALSEMGADPTVITPSADVAAVSSNGILQVVTDPRTNLKQSLEAMLIAELVDNDAWALLCELARTVGKKDLGKKFEEARREEEDHLTRMREWVVQTTLMEAGDQFPDASERLI